MNEFLNVVANIGGAILRAELGDQLNDQYESKRRKKHLSKKEKKDLEFTKVIADFLSE